uniref:Endonuclease/exonuclease/phosphatase domain-containing protein n=1 Tax=Lotharella oceanica TaxID=641309 RepID=A0A7S2XH44_9EUKA
MDYPPFTVLIKDERFTLKNLQWIAVTSVHMPPRTKTRQQAVQTRGFFKNYMRTIRAGLGNTGKDAVLFSATRSKGASPHIVVGDWNHYPRPSDGTWSVCGDEKTITSSGGYGYDYCCYNTSVKDHAKVHQIVWPLPESLKSNYRKGQMAVSDHDILAVTLCERLDRAASY